MKGKTLKVILAVAMVLALSAPCFAAAVKTISVTAYVPTLAGGLSIMVNKLPPTGWPQVAKGATLPIDFGTLTLDPTYNIFRAGYYYAVDVGVTDNSGTVWSITHTRTSLLRDAINNLDGNVNVSFSKVVKGTTTDTETSLDKMSYANSNAKAYNKTQLSGGWLRIYYGLGTGSGDNTGVLPVGLDKPAGTYAGTVTITLTP